MPRLSAFIFIACLFLSHCAPYSEAFQMGRTDADAENSIMLVIDHPASLGFKRLQYAKAIHPEFASFVNQVGTPDCIAETTQGDRHYMILYYIQQRQAYSCRSEPGRPSRPMEVSGPYPISDKEYKLLSTFKLNALKSLVHGPE